MDRSRLSGWADLMDRWGIRQPPRLQRALANRTGPARQAARQDMRRDVRDVRQDRRQNQGRGRRGYDVSLDPPVQGGSPPSPRYNNNPNLSETEWNARMASVGYTGGGQSYTDYIRSDDMANNPDPRYTVPTQINGTPNAIPYGARITDLAAGGGGGGGSNPVDQEWDTSRPMQVMGPNGQMMTVYPYPNPGQVGYGADLEPRTINQGNLTHWGETGDQVIARARELGIDPRLLASAGTPTGITKRQIRRDPRQARHETRQIQGAWDALLAGNTPLYPDRGISNRGLTLDDALSKIDRRI